MVYDWCNCADFGRYRGGPAHHADRAIPAGRGLGIRAQLSPVTRKDPVTPNIRPADPCMAGPWRHWPLGEDLGGCCDGQRRHHRVFSWPAIVVGRRAAGNLHGGWQLRRYQAIPLNL